MDEVLALREHWCHPGEQIAWVCKTKLPFGYDVKGLGKWGGPAHQAATDRFRPKKNAGGNAIANVVGFVAFGGDETSPDTAEIEPLPPAVFVEGRRADCAANRLVEDGLARADEGFWVFTSHRLAWVGSAAEPTAPPHDDSGKTGGGLLGRVQGFLQDGNTEPAPRPVPQPGVRFSPLPVGPHAEVSRQEIITVEPITRKVRGARYKKPHYLRMSFRDGSVLDVNGDGSERPIKRMLEMSYGRA